MEEPFSTVDYNRGNDSWCNDICIATHLSISHQPNDQEGNNDIRYCSNGISLRLVGTVSFLIYFLTYRPNRIFQ